MCNSASPTPKKGWEGPIRDAMSGVAHALQYTVPVARNNGGCSYIEFYAYDPELGRLRRKRIKTNRIQGVNNRRQYIKDVIKRVTDQLSHGWNPWIAKDASDLYLMSEAIERYDKHITKMLEGGYYRKETYNGYKSYLKILQEYIKKVKPIHYVYQFDRTYCVDFLDHVFIKRDCCAQTRNNYLNFLRVFSGFLVDKGYQKHRVTDGIQPISKRLIKKGRTTIPLETVSQIGEYCRKHDPHFMLACYLLYYSFIRPVEMMRLKIGMFNLRYGTLTIPAGCSKNGKEQVVTIPKKVLLYAAEIGIFSAATSDYVFSDCLRPGPRQSDPKVFRDHWAKVKKELKLREEWKFYSLKDTGITAMLKSKMPAIEVRDQARHSSLAITELYTDHSEDVNPEILKFDGAL